MYQEGKPRKFKKSNDDDLWLEKVKARAEKKRRNQRRDKRNQS